MKINIEEQTNYLDIMKAALSKKDYATYSAARDMLEESVSDMKENDSLARELDSVNFGVLNHIFESVLPTLFKSNKSVVKKVVNLIKEDKNLSAEFAFYNSVKNYMKHRVNESVSSSDALDAMLSEYYKVADLPSVKESNKKFMKLLKECNIIPSEHLDSKSRNLYEAVDKLLTNGTTLSNVLDSMFWKNEVSRHLDENKVSVNEDKNSIIELIDDFEDKLKDKLTESEVSFVQEITDFRNPIAEERKKKLFNLLKNECLSKMDELLKEGNDNLEIKSLREKISSKEFNNETIVKDIANMMEVRDILFDK